MENLLRKYMEERFADSETTEPSGRLPFVTISREFGCPSKLIAKLLAESLNENPSPRKKPLPWRYINKEIVMDSAHDLDIDPSRVQHLFDAEQHHALDDIFASFSEHYRSDRKIIKTIRDVVKSFVHKGNIILVGRGGAAITQGYHNVLHVRLQAPLEWRIKEICALRGVSAEDAHRLAIETDKKRTALMEIFLGKKFDLSMFDLVFNCQTFDPECVVGGIIRMMEIKNMI
jgi:cytidylate kinase